MINVEELGCGHGLINVQFPYLPAGLKKSRNAYGI
jgi:hypothetical protein